MNKEKTDTRVQRPDTERETGADRDSLLKTDGLMGLHFIFIDWSGNILGMSPPLTVMNHEKPDPKDKKTTKAYTMVTRYTLTNMKERGMGVVSSGWGLVPVKET